MPKPKPSDMDSYIPDLPELEGDYLGLDDKISKPKVHEKPKVHDPYHDPYYGHQSSPQYGPSSCPPNSFYNPPAYRCDCNHGYKWNYDKTACIKGCSSN